MNRLFQGLNPRYLLIFVISGALALAQILLYQQRISEEGGGFKPDFVAYYTAATLAESGRAPYDIAAQSEVQHAVMQAVSNEPQSLLPFLYPPHSLWLFRPFAQMSYADALVWWTGLQQGLFVAMLCVLACFARSQTHAMQWPLALLIAAMHPLVMLVWFQGQITLLLLVAMLGFALAVQRKHHWLAALCLMVIAIKPQLALPFIVYALMVQPRQIGGPTLLLGAALVGLDVLAGQGQWWLVYSGYIADMLQGASLYDTGYDEMRSLPTLLQYIAGNDSSLLRAGVALAGAVLAAAVAWRGRNDTDKTALLMLLCAIGFFTSPWLHRYDMLLYLLPMSWLFCQPAMQQNAARRIVLWGLQCVLLLSGESMLAAWLFELGLLPMLWVQHKHLSRR